MEWVVFREYCPKLVRLGALTQADEFLLSFPFEAAMIPSRISSSDQSSTAG